MSCIVKTISPALGDAMNEVALTILDDDGQVQVAECVCNNELFMAQILLVRAAYQKRQLSELSEEEYGDIIRRVEVTPREKSQIESDLLRGDRLWD